MKKSSLLRVEIVSLIGLLFAWYAFLFGAWVKRPLGPDISGWELWLSLRLTLSNPDALTDASRQQAVYFWLSALVAALVVQSLVTAILFAARKSDWGYLSLVLWGLSLLSSGTLLLSYGANLPGVLLMMLTSAAALGCELLALYFQAAAPRLDHAAALPKVSQAWENVITEAGSEHILLSFLAIAAEPGLDSAELPGLQRELRGRDLLFPVRSGLFALLWQTSPAGAPLIAARLRQALEQSRSGRQVQIGIACFPADGARLTALLESAVQALNSARQAGSPAVVSHSDPAHSEALTMLSSWEKLLTVAQAEDLTVALLAFHAGRPLQAAELALIQKELRGNDRLSVFEQGCYVLLWKTAAQGAEVVQEKIQQLLQAAGVQSRAALALFPQDGKQLSELLEKVA